MKIFVVNHTKFEQSYKNNYYPLLVGAFDKNKEVKESILCDDTGENISELNNSYCELTGLYWLWKNVDDPVVGLTHYRRFFLTTKKYVSFHDNVFLVHPERIHNCHIMTSEEAEKILTRYDIIVKKSHRYRWTLRDKLIDCIPEECLDNLLMVLSERSNDDYLKFQKYLNKHSQILFNMFIGKKEIINQYCEWLFPIIMSVDQKHLSNCGERYHKRELGYLGEILFSFWIISNHIKYYKAESIMPRKSKIKVVDDIQFPDGTNIFSIKEFFPNLLTLFSKYVIKQKG